jgi:hypothetical protein
MRYESFALHIEPAQDGSFAVSVESPQGEGRGIFQVPGGGALPSAAAGPARGREGEVRDVALAAAPRKTLVLAALEK